MRAAVYARVSTTRQAQAQTIEQQLDRLREAITGRGWELDDQHVYRDDGYSGASLGRPGLDRLRDHAALAELDVVVVTEPDRLARNYVHQVLLIDELAGYGCRVEFLDRPMSADPHDQLLLQIRGAVAEYERTLITERMRRGRHARLRAGTLLPWTRPPFGYRLDPDRPRDAAAVRVDPGEAALVAQLFDWYLEPQATLYRLTARLADLGVPTPAGKPRWNVASVRGILRNPAYAGRAGREPCPAAVAGLDRGAGPADHQRGDLRPGPGQARCQPAGRGAQHPPRVPAARAGQLRRMPAGLHRPPARRRLPLLPVPRAHRPAARSRRTALHRPLHPRRAAGRAGLGRPARAADGPRPGGPRAGPRTRRRLAAPGTPGQAGGHPPGPGPARPPAATALGRLPRRGHHPG